MISIDQFITQAAGGTAGADLALDPTDRFLALVVSPSAERRHAAARAVARSWGARHPSGIVLPAAPAAIWPFLHPLVPPLPDRPVIVWAPDVHEAVINHQTGGPRLITTQAGYLFETWRHAIAARDDVLVLATADLETLRQHAPETLTGRAPFRDALVHVVPDASASARPIAGELRRDRAEAASGREGRPGAPVLMSLAIRATEPAERLSLCARALDCERTAAALVATASARMERNDLEGAARDLDEALALAPEWPAAHFERGKVWLRADDMARANACFREAAERMPAFVSAWANLGATLGELDQPEAALAAFRHALATDPDNHQVLNNVGVVSRELGRLAESEGALRQVIALAPHLAFGYYNLGHTLFLQGRFHAALSAYAEGQRRDPERNPVQASRLALSKLATGDAAGALADLKQATAMLPPAYRQQLLADTASISMALLTHQPDLPGWATVNEWLQGELARPG